MRVYIDEMCAIVSLDPDKIDNVITYLNNLDPHGTKFNFRACLTQHL